MEKRPQVSVIMPVFNTEKYVAEAVESVFAQTYTDLELICIDDGSSDRSLEVLGTFGDRVTILRNEQNLGIALTRNKGIEAALGSFIAFMDADDIWKPEKLEKQMRQLESQPELSVSFCAMQCFLSPELPEEVRAVRYCPTDPNVGYIPGTALIRRSAFDTVGMLDGQWKIGEFIDWLSRAKDKGLTFGVIDEVLYLRRIHETNTGVNERASRVDYLRIARNAITRRRAAEHEAPTPPPQELPE